MPNTQCCVPLCSNRGGHMFPKDEDLRRKWMVAVRRTKCMEAKLRKGSVPSQFAWTKARSAAAQARENRASNREAQKASRKVLAEPDDGYTNIIIDGSLDDCYTEEEKEPDPAAYETVEALPETSAPSTETSRPPTAVYQPVVVVVQAPPNTTLFTAQRFKNDDEGMKYFTGLETYEKFMMVLQTLGPAAHDLKYLYGNVIAIISVEDQFLLTLMKLRRHKPNFELSRDFDISKADVYNIIVTWIQFMYLQWKEVPVWQSRDLVRFFSPTDFKAKFPSTRLIVDWTEFFVKKSKVPSTQQCTFSTYKNGNTMKVLVGSTPGGLISYVSPAYGGSTSDRQIVERSFLPQDCDPKDSIMADKGFNVQDIFAPYDVTVNIPTFFKKKNRLQSETVLKDRKIASKRVHIERLIGLAKSYKILKEPMLKWETQMSTQISFVVFMLCNFRNCIVPKHA